MKIKQLIFQIFLSLLVLYFVAQYTSSITISQTFSFAIIFYLLYVAVALATQRFVTFFLLPKGFPFAALIQSVLLFVVIYLCTSFLGGVAIHFMAFPSFGFLGVKVIGTSLGLFGTIAVDAVLIGIVYQLLIWLNEQK